MPLESLQFPQLAAASGNETALNQVRGPVFGFGAMFSFLFSFIYHSAIPGTVSGRGG